MKPDQAYEYAYQNAPRNDDGSVPQKRLHDLIIDHLDDLDQDQAKADMARKLIRRKKQPGHTMPKGQLCLPGMEPYAFEPERLIADEEGNVIRNNECRPNFKLAEANRARQNLNRVASWFNRKQEEANRYAEWAMQQLSDGRRADEITFGTFVRETGFWHNGDAPIEDGPEEPETLL